MIVFIVAISLVVLFVIGILLYFFTIAFVKIKKGDLEDLNHPENIILEPYKEIVKSGLDFINNSSYKWVYTKSFDGLKLAARYFDNKRENTMILFHGYRSAAARDFSCAVKMYTDMGFNILLCDQRSHGKSEGKLITFGVKESRDVISWIEFINQEYKPEGIALGGMSMGATTVVLACGYELPNNVKCVIADCGFTSPADIINIVAKRNYKINASFFLPILNVFCKLFGRFSIFGISTTKAVKNSKIPILFIHGLSDGFVPCEMSQRGYNANPEKSEILLIEDADHGMAFLKDTEKVYSNLEKFLKKNIL